MPQRFVNIITSDRGWVLEKMARELSETLPYVDYTGAPNDDALINYYFTYGAYRGKSGRLDLAWFTHIEEDPQTRKKFFDVAHEIDFCVTHAKIYEEALRADGVSRVETIPPGVDLDAFRPKLRIGVIGRTYHTGRKGEALMRQVMDVEGIEWRFTGSGWPGEARFIPGDKLPDFYNDLDYVLVPAYFEGGPMCVIEALACGVEVIAPPIGWVPDYPHIEYKTGDADSLRAVLTRLVAERQALRASVEDAGWSRWSEGHDRLFRRLLGEIDASPPSAGFVNIPKPLKTQIVLHGDEKTTRGGPSRRAPRLATELRRLGYDATLHFAANAPLRDADVIHGVNIWNPNSSLKLAERARLTGKPYVFSPILLDFSENGLWNAKLPALAAHAGDLEDFAEKVEAHRASGQEDPPVEAFHGFTAIARKIIGAADHLIYLSEHERRLITELMGRETPGALVHNPVDASTFAHGDAQAFQSEYGLSDFVLVTARVERRKNQLMLIAALRDLDIPIVLAGHPGDAEYAAHVRRLAGPNVHMIGRLSSPEIVAGALAAASVFALPSFAEGAPLAALEAGAAGPSLVLSDRSSEQEYFGDRARYCDPASIASIRDAVAAAWDARQTHDRGALKRFTAETYSWARHTRETAKAYAAAHLRAASTPKQISAPAQIKTEGPLYFDVTTSAGRRGRWTGISRSEMSIALSMLAKGGRDIRFTVWNNELGHFFEAPRAIVESGAISSFVKDLRNETEEIELEDGGDFLVLGSGWMQNPRYCLGVCNFAKRHRLGLSVLIHDVIPCKFPHWFESKYEPVFTRNLEVLLRHADRLIANSQNTRRDVIETAVDLGVEIGPVDVVRLGDDSVGLVDEPSQFDEAASDKHRWLLDKTFILNVGAIHARKNQAMLYQTWRRLAREMGEACPHLVIVGGVAWLGDLVGRAFQSDPEVRDRVHVLSDVDDDFLDALYAHCRFTVYPSLYEGWGLPITESLKAGKLCLTSNLSSMVEVAPEFTDRLDPEDPDAWRYAIKGYLDDPAKLEAREAKIKAGFTVSTWADCAAQLSESLTAPYAARRRKLALGQMIDCRNGVNIEHAAFDGFVHRPNGMVPNRREAALRLSCDLKAENGVKLALAWAPGKTASHQTRRVYVNGHEVGAFRQPYGAPFPTVFEIDQAYLSDEAEQDVRIVTDADDDHPALTLIMLARRDAIVDLGPIARIDQRAHHFQLGHIKDFEDDASLRAMLQDEPAKIAINALFEQPGPSMVTVWFDGLPKSAAQGLTVLVNGEKCAVETHHTDNGLQARFTPPVERIRAIPMNVECQARVGGKLIGLRIDAAAVHRQDENPSRIPLSAAEPAPSTAVGEVALGDLLTGRRLWPDQGPIDYRGAWLGAGAKGRSATASLKLAYRPNMLNRSRKKLLVMASGERLGAKDVGAVHLRVGGAEVSAPIDGDRFAAVVPITAKAISRQGVLELKLLTEAASLFRLLALRIVPEPDEAFDAHAVAGDLHRDIRAWPAAAEAYQQALAAAHAGTPAQRQAAISVQYGHALKESGDYDAAEAAYLAARDITPDDADIYLQLGHLMNRSGDRAAARAYYEDARKIDPLDDDILRNLSDVSQ